MKEKGAWDLVSNEGHYVSTFFMKEASEMRSQKACRSCDEDSLTFPVFRIRYLIFFEHIFDLIKFGRESKTKSKRTHSKRNGKEEE
jgi:hypothetical protein